MRSIILYMQIGVHNVTIVSTSYEQREKALFNYAHYKYKTNIGREKRANISGRVMEDLLCQPTQDYVLVSVNFFSRGLNGSSVGQTW
jgi:hypothetical protein